MMDAVKMLRNDYQQIRQLFRDVEQADDHIDVKRDLGDRVLTEVEAHSTLEEEMFYPAVREQAPDLDDLIQRSYDEHRLIDQMITHIRATDILNRMYDVQMRELRKYVERHMVEAEEDLLPRAQRALGREELDRLGQQMEQRKQQLVHRLRRAA